MDFNLEDIYRDYHGIDISNLRIPFPSDSFFLSRILKERFPDMPELEYEEADELSWVGTPVWFPITLLGGTYLRYRNAELVEKEMQDLRLPLSCVCEFSRAKDIAYTSTTGEVGAIPEMFGFESWSITISGFILPDPNQVNDLVGIEDQFTALKEFEELADAIKVQGDLFSRHDIEEIIIESMSDKQVTGQPGIIPISLQCRSHTPVDLIIEG